MNKVYIVQVQGWGDDENAMYNVAAFSTRDKADAGLEEILLDWEDNGGTRDEVVYEIEVITVDA